MYHYKAYRVWGSIFVSGAFLLLATTVFGSLSLANAGEAADWRFCVLGTTPSGLVFITNVFRDERISGAVEADVARAARGAGIDNSPVQCLMPTTKDAAENALKYAIEFNNAFGSQIRTLKLQ